MENNGAWWLRWNREPSRVLDSNSALLLSFKFWWIHDDAQMSFFKLTTSMQMIQAAVPENHGAHSPPTVACLWQFLLQKFSCCSVFNYVLVPLSPFFVDFTFIGCLPGGKLGVKGTVALEPQALPSKSFVTLTLARLPCLEPTHE